MWATLISTSCAAVGGTSICFCIRQQRHTSPVFGLGEAPKASTMGRRPIPIFPFVARAVHSIL